MSKQGHLFSPCWRLPWAGSRPWTVLTTALPLAKVAPSLSLSRPALPMLADTATHLTTDAACSSRHFFHLLNMRHSSRSHTAAHLRTPWSLKPAAYAPHRVGTTRPPPLPNTPP